MAGEGTIGEQAHRFPEQAWAALAEYVAHDAEVSSGHRYVLGITGSPGGGKTTAAKALVAHANERAPGAAAYVPMDGFHLASSTLDGLGLRRRKGAIETFDGWGFLALLKRLRRETHHTVYAPGFDRAVDEGVAGAIAVDPSATLVIVEGNYLLATQDPWSQVRGQLDAIWFCATPEITRESRLVDRHVRHGRTPEAAAAWARDVDGANSTLIEATRDQADLIFCGVTGEILPARLQ